MIKIPSTNPNAVHEWIEAVNEYETDYTISSVAGLNDHFTLVAPFTLKVFKQGTHITLKAVFKISADSSATGGCGVIAIDIAGKVELPDTVVSDVAVVSTALTSGLSTALEPSYINPGPSTLSVSGYVIPPSSTNYFILNFDYHL